MGVNQQQIPFPLRSSLPSCFGYSLQRFTLIMFNFVTPWLLSTILNVFDNLLSECSVALLEACTISPGDTTRYSPLNNRINFPNEFFHRSTTMTCCPLPSSSRVQFLFLSIRSAFPKTTQRTLYSIFDYVRIICCRMYCFRFAKSSKQN